MIKLRSLIIALALAVVVAASGYCATVYKVLGQVAPSATTATTLYTVPSATTVVVSQITVANRAGTSGSFRIAVRPAGAALSNEHYIAYDTPVPANDTVILPGGQSLAATDVVTVYASSANFSFNIFGAEIQ
jgi:small-conductance mechanosensitive channel